MGSLTTNNSGSVANFQSQTYAPIRSLKARFMPVQFDKIDISVNNPKSIYEAAPQFVYVGDDLPITYDSARTVTSNGLTWSIDGNGWCSFNGTPTAFSGIDIGKYYIRSGTETVKIKLIGDCSSRIITTNTTSFYNANGGFLGSVGSDAALQNGINMAEYLEIYPTASYIKISLKRYNNDVFIQGKVFVTLDIDDKPMYTAIPMTDNLFDVYNSTYYRWINNTGNYQSNNTGLVGNTISVNPNESYTIGYFGTKPNNFSIIELDKDRKFIKENNKDLTGNNTTPLTVTTTDTTHYIIPQISCYPNALTPQEARDWKIKLVKGDTLTSYGNAYYGGYIDLITGEVVIDWRETTVGECDISKNSDSLEAWTNFYIYPQPRCIKNQSTRELHCACDQIITTPQEGWLLTQEQTKTIIWSSAYDGTFRVKSQEYASLTAEELKQLFYDATIIYRVQDPIATYQLTPQQLNTLIGKNYMWTNTGNIEVEYDLTEMCNVQMARHRMLMSAPHTETVSSASSASFNTDMSAKLKSCKTYISASQDGSGTVSLSNVRKIDGSSMVTISQSGKNIGHVFAYGTFNTNTDNPSEFGTTNSYGTTINTTTFTLPDTPLIITQSQWPETQNLKSYKNGYFTIGVDNLIWGKSYNISFKISNITGNPLNATYNDIVLQPPLGNQRPPTTIIGDKLIYKNVPWKPYAINNLRKCFELRNCGMSFTLSEFMITPVEDENHTQWIPYNEGEITKIILPTSKNLFDHTAYNWSGLLANLSDYYGTYTNTNTDTVTSENLKLLLIMTNFNSEIGRVTLESVSIGRNSITFTTTSNCNRLTFRQNEINRRIGIIIPWFYPPGTYTISFDVVANDPTTVGGFIIKDIQIEAGTATAYEPYSPTYGGTLDLTNGQLTVTHVGFKKKLSEAYSKTDFDNCVAYRFHENFDGGQVVTNNTQISNIAPYQYEGNAGKVPHFYATYGSSTNTNIIIVYVPIGTDENTEFQAVLPLSEPLTYQLTPETIRAAKGMNNIWGDTNGNTEVTYWTH